MEAASEVLIYNRLLKTCGLRDHQVPSTSLDGTDTAHLLLSRFIYMSVLLALSLPGSFFQTANLFSCNDASWEEVSLVTHYILALILNYPIILIAQRVSSQKAIGKDWCCSLVKRRKMHQMWRLPAVMLWLLGNSLWPVCWCLHSIPLTQSFHFSQQYFFLHSQFTRPSCAPALFSYHCLYSPIFRCSLQTWVPILTCACGFRVSLSSELCTLYCSPCFTRTKIDQKIFGWWGLNWSKNWQIWLMSWAPR